MHLSTSQSTPNPAVILTHAVLRAADLLGLKDVDLARIIGVSAPTISRCKRGETGIDPHHKAGEMALLLIRLFRSLVPLVGSDPEKCKVWMRTENRALGGIPASLIRRTEGLVRTLAYLDGLRAPA